MESYKQMNEHEKTEEIAITECGLYQYYAKTMHLDSVISIFVDRKVNPEICQKAMFYFDHFCLKCKVFNGNGNGFKKEK